MTDWTAYYQQTPGYTHITRSISERRLMGLFKSLCPGTQDICELGGANSCFLDGVIRQLSVRRYHIVDLNDFGLNLLRNRDVEALTFERGDVLTPYKGSDLFDIVYSVGLIEHFDLQGTAAAIKAHFDRCRPGGIVLITFPTPTILYRIIRGAAEAVGKWGFPDERPLQFGEVLETCRQNGEVVHQSINWPILLTQGYVAVRKAS